MWEQVLEIWEELAIEDTAPNEATFLLPMTAYENLGRWEESMHLLKEMSHARVSPSALSYSVLLGGGSGAEAGSSWERALQIFDEMLQRGIDPDEVFRGQLADILAKGGQWALSIDLLRSCLRSNVELNDYTYSSALSACGNANEWQHAILTLRDIQSFGVSPGHATYNAAMSALHKGNQGTLAVKLLDEIDEEGPGADIMTINACIAACADDVSMNMKRCDKLFSSIEGRGLAPTAPTYNSMMAACSKNSLWTRALSLAKEMKGLGLERNEQSFVIMAGILAQRKRGDQALGLLDEFRESGREPNLIFYNSVLAALAACNDGKKAEKLMRQMDRRRVAPDVLSFNTAISAFEADGHWTVALNLLKQMQQGHLQPDIVTFSTAISACEKDARWDVAVPLFEEMQEEHDIEPNVISYNAVVAACARGGKQDLAAEFMQEMEDKSLNPDGITYSARINSIVRPGVANVTLEPSVYVAQKWEDVTEEQLEGALPIYRKGIERGVVNPWSKSGNFLDLHKMNADMARVAVYHGLQEVKSLPDDDPRLSSWLTRGLKIVCGRGIHSKGGVPILQPALKAMLTNLFGFRCKQDYTGGAITILGSDLRRYREGKAAPPRDKLARPKAQAPA